MILRQFGALLSEGHSGIYYTPDYIVDFRRRHFSEDWFDYFCTDDGVFVTSVRENIIDYLPLNSEIINIDNTPVEEYFQKHCYPYLTSIFDHTLKSRCYECRRSTRKRPQNISVKSTEGEIIDFSFPNGNPANYSEIKSYDVYKHRDSRPREHSHKWIDNNILYIDIAGSIGMHTVKYFQENFSALEESSGIIMDLRNCLGGNSVGYHIANIFTENDTIEQYYYIRTNTASKRATGAFVDSTHQNYGYYHNTQFELDSFISINTIEKEHRLIGKPIVILIDNNVVSASENFLIVFKKLNLATFVGRPTFGSCSQPFIFQLPGNGYAWLATQKTMITLDEEFTFIEPDYYVKLNLEDLIRGNDPIFEKGLCVINQILE